MTNLRDLNKEERINTLIEHHFNYNSSLSSISSFSFIDDSHTNIEELTELFEGIQEKTLYIATSPAFDYSYTENGELYSKNYNVNTYSYNSIEQAIIKMNNIEEYECIAFYSILKNSMSFQGGFNLRYAIIEDEIAKKIIERDNKIDSILKNKN
jgi:predicted transcriptional regulator